MEDVVQHGDNSMAALSEMAERLIKAEAEVARIEEELSAAKEAARDIAERQLPELMEELDIDKFSTKGGLKIDVKESIRAALPASRRVEGILWLEQNGLGRLVKREVKVPLGKGQEELAKKVERLITDALPGQLVDYEASVHPQTLAAAVREALENGQDIPLDLLGVHRSRVAKVTIPRSKRA